MITTPSKDNYVNNYKDFNEKNNLSDINLVTSKRFVNKIN